jgi:hypothetical protein
MRFCPNGGQAGEQCLNAAMHELAAEIVECAAFYSVSAEGAEVTPGGQEAAKTMNSAGRDMISLGLLIGRDLNISPQATTARVPLYTREMLKLVGPNGSTANWPILILRYKDKCDALKADATARQLDLYKQECFTR